MNALPMIDDRFEVYRIVTDFEGLREAFVDRVEDMQVTRLAVDEAGGFTGGHASKILCTPPIKRLGETSLAKMLKATGMALVLVIDDERFKPVHAQMEKRKRPRRPMQARARILKIRGYFTKENAAKWGEKRWDGVSLAKRSRLARRAARARWSRAKRLALAAPVEGFAPNGG